MDKKSKIIFSALLGVCLTGLCVGGWQWYSAVRDMRQTAELIKQQMEQEIDYVQDEELPPQQAPDAKEEVTQDPTKEALLKTAEGILTFEDQGYSIAVLPGISQQTLRYGAGRALGTVKVGENGNSVLFGHRDSNFKALSSLEVDDVITFTAKEVKYSFKVTEISIVQPDDPSIFNDSDSPLLTLVTCYPFVFSGPSPQRCVFRASLI